MLIDRYGIHKTSASAWHTLVSFRQFKRESIKIMTYQILEFAKVAYSEVELTTPLIQRRVQIFTDALLTHAIKLKLLRDKP